MHAHMPRSPYIRYGRATAAVLLTFVAGCAHRTATHEDGLTGEPAVFAPAVHGASDGLELQWWVVRGDLHDLAEFPALQPFRAAPATLQRTEDDVSPSDLWQTHGLRVFTVDLADLPELERRLGITDGASTSGLGIQRQWLGQVTAWTPLVEGPSRGRIGIWTESGPFALPAGQLRLLGRAWTEPVPQEAASLTGPASGLRVELVPQHAESLPEDPFGLSTAREPTEEGLLFRRLALTAQLDGRRALVIVPERPDAVWGESQPAPPAPVEVGEPQSPTRAPPLGHIVRDPERARSIPEPLDEQPETESTGPDVAANVPARINDDQTGPGPAPEPFRGEARIVAAGPAGPRLPTLGEAMLMSSRQASPEGPKRTTRAVVVLIPRLPEEYRLLPH